MPVLTGSAGPYAVTADVQSEWHQPLTDEQLPWVQAKIDRATRKLLRRIPDLDARITDGRLTTEDVRDAIVDAVLRVLRNPSGYKSEQDGDYGYSLNSRDASASIWFPDDVIADLLGVPRTRKAGTISVGVPAHRVTNR